MDYKMTSDIEKPKAKTFLDRLRAKTAGSHQKLEDQPISKSIMNPTVSKEQYIQYLDLMHNLVKDAEENIFPQLSEIITDFEHRKKAHLLENDFAFLNFKKENINEKPLSLNTSNSIPFNLGIMYVIEGSSLGGRFILKNIQKALGYNENGGATYFEGYGNRTGSTWKTFLNTMIAFENENNCEAEIIAGADYAYDTIAEYFISKEVK